MKTLRSMLRITRLEMDSQYIRSILLLILLEICLNFFERSLDTTRHNRITSRGSEMKTLRRSVLKITRLERDDKYGIR